MSLSWRVRAAWQHFEQLCLAMASQLLEEALGSWWITWGKWAGGSKRCSNGGGATWQNHCLTHVPYATWCEHCVAHRAQPDRHERSDLSKESSISAVSSELWLLLHEVPGWGWHGGWCVFFYVVGDDWFSQWILATLSTSLQELKNVSYARDHGFHPELRVFSSVLF